MFRRRRRDEPTIPDEDFSVEEEELPREGPAPGARVGAGPWDAGEAPADDIARLDLGALKVPVYEDMEVRVEVGEDSQVMTATLVYDGGALQLNAFAAPRREGLWPEVRQEITASVADAGGSGEEAAGPFGTELRAQVPGQPAGPGQGLQPARFLGVDGPRWFLRGVITGPAATGAGPAERLEEAFRQVVVVRGADAMPPRDPLPLQLPKEAVEAAVPEPGLDPFQRGPEITEIQ